ncbi:flagellar brake protein [Silvimonas amylolytica]|uniref:Flagellar brake protein YcgR n=1 Tax=Silvimonas amylolytica TaxID=449663 RepID=A0ABQ2PKP5_9NEIS|nr:flagellar brake protein [Silvimonas amylolytica]GGP26188.1 flagellar brake protein YcgR [Silvimonas amylolytica]
MSEPENNQERQMPIAEGEDVSPFLLSNPLEIGAVMRQLVQRGDFVTVYFSHGQKLMLSRILTVDVPNREIVLDVGGHEPTNEALAQSDRNIVVALPDGVKIQFVIGRPKLIKYEGSPAFSVPFPKDLIKLQRREFFRIETPLVRPWLCDTVLADRQRAMLEIHDISLGGVGLWATPAQAAQLQAGEQLSKAELELGQWGAMSVALEVRSRRVMTNRTGQEVHHIGCRFLNLNRQAEATLQKLLAQLERERKALVGR